jgi:hypothetical protein
MILEFTGEVEGNLREILLCHLQHIVAVGQEHVSTFKVNRHELVLTLLEGVQGVFIVTLDPTGLV